MTEIRLLGGDPIDDLCLDLTKHSSAILSNSEKNRTPDPNNDHDKHTTLDDGDVAVEHLYLLRRIPDHIGNRNDEWIPEWTRSFCKMPFEIENARN